MFTIKQPRQTKEDKEIQKIVDDKFKKLTESVIKWQISQGVTPENAKDFKVIQILDKPGQIKYGLFKKEDNTTLVKPISILTLNF